ncbi:MAG: nuclear transport factor 2 family protein [Acidimicrobiia bacterium]
MGVRLADDAIRQWPQSGEAIEGRARIGEVETHFEGLQLAVGRRHACGGTLIVEWSADYGDGRVYRNITVADLRDGRVTHATDNWGEPFELPKWRESLAQVLDMPPHGIWPAVDVLRGDDDAL